MRISGSPPPPRRDEQQPRKAKTKSHTPWTIIVRHNAATGAGSCCFLNCETNQEGPRRRFTGFGESFQVAHLLAEADAEELLESDDDEAVELLDRAIGMALGAGSVSES